MILPTSIPYWQKIIQNLNEKSADLKLNVDPFSGKHGGTIFYKGESYSFKIEVFPQNMVLSLKDANTEIFDLFSTGFEFGYSVIYETKSTDSVFNVHAEWYFKCTNEDIRQEVNRLSGSSSVNIIKINIPSEE